MPDTYKAVKEFNLFKSIFTDLGKLFREKAIFFTLLFYTIYYLLTLTTAYPIFEDEAWYSSSAYNFSQGAWITNDLAGYGFPNFIFPIFEGIVFKILGVSFFNARFTSFLFGFFSIIIFNSILKLINVKNQTILLVLLIFVSSPCYFFAFHIARPESVAIFFSLAAILFFLKSIPDEKHQTRNICFCSLFCGIAFLSHPYTFPLYFVFGFYYLILFSKQKKFLKVFYFCMVGTLIFLLFLFNSYFVTENNLQVILTRTSTSNSVLSNSSQFFKNFLNIKNISKNGLFLIGSAIFPGLILWKNSTLKRISFAVIIYLIIASFILSPGYKGNFYMLNYIGLFSLVAIAELVNIYDNKIVLLICFFYIMSYSILDIKKNSNNYNVINEEINLQLNAQIPPGSKVFGDIRFWFMLPKTHYTAIYWNWKKPPLNVSLSETDWIIVCDDSTYNNITNFDRIKKSMSDMNLKVDTVLNIPTKHYGSIKVYKNNK
jgi:hypothetical protein